MSEALDKEEIRIKNLIKSSELNMDLNLILLFFFFKYLFNLIKYLVNCSILLNLLNDNIAFVIGYKNV